MNATAIRALQRLGRPPDAYGRLLATALFPAWEAAIRRRPTLDRLSFLERSQWRSLDELVALQTAMLRGLVGHAFDHVPLYRRRFLDAGMTPDDVREPADLRHLPILDREEARDAGAARQATVAPFTAVRKTTGGSTGIPLVFGYDLGSEVWRQAVRLRGYAWAGFPIGARSLHYWAQIPAAGLRRRLKVAADRRLKRELHVDCVPRGERHMRAAVEAIRRHRPHAIVTYSQAGAALARYVAEAGARAWGAIPVLCGAERLFDADRRAIVEAFGPAVFETYGSREFMLIASECEAHDGLHTAMENLLVEVVVRDGGVERPAEPGEVGELVVTDLHNFAMPFIRYAIGDLAVARAPGRCGCGRELLKIGPIEGRVTETLRDAEGRPVSGILFSVLFTVLAQHARQFQVIQRRDRSVIVRLVPDRDLGGGELEKIRAYCAGYLPGIEIATVLVDDIAPARSGKRQVVVVES
jgi:phenylacetate-CoA ligase